MIEIELIARTYDMAAIVRGREGDGESKENTDMFIMYSALTSLFQI